MIWISLNCAKRRSILVRMHKRLMNNAGNAALEFAFAFGIFGTPLLLGTTELSLLVYDSIELSNSAHAGAMYGMISSTFAGDTAGIQKAAQGEAADFGTNVTVTPTTYYACSNAVDGTISDLQRAERGGHRVSGKCKQPLPSVCESRLEHEHKPAGDVSRVAQDVDGERDRRLMEVQE